MRAPRCQFAVVHQRQQVQPSQRHTCDAGARPAAVAPGHRTHGRPAGRRSTRLARGSFRACLLACKPCGRRPPYGPRRVATLATLHCPHVQRAQRSARGHSQVSAGVPVPERVGLRPAAIVQVALSSACCARPCAPPAGAQRSVTAPTTARRVGIQGAFLAYFLCTSKESESAAGPKPPPALQPNTRQTIRNAHSIASKAKQSQARPCSPSPYRSPAAVFA